MNYEPDISPHPDWFSVDRMEDTKPEYRLLLRVVIEAMGEYFVLKRMGAVKYMKQTGYFLQRSGGAYVYMGMTPRDIYFLLKFINEDAERLMNLAGWDLPPLAVRNIILRLEKSGDYRKYFSQGVPGEGDWRRRRRSRAALEDEEGGQPISD